MIELLIDSISLWN